MMKELSKAKDTDSGDFKKVNGAIFPTEKSDAIAEKLGTRRIDLNWALDKIKQREWNAAIDAVLEILRDPFVFTNFDLSNPAKTFDAVSEVIESLRRGEQEASNAE